MMAGSPLPRQPTSFIGRETEMAEIASRLAQVECRLLSLVGPGGIGKTRLALQTAARVAPNYPDGVIFADLQTLTPASPAADDDPLATAIADAGGLPSGSREKTRERLLAYLADKEQLLLLDNFERFLHVSLREESVALLADILQEAPTVTLLLTSRIALNLQQEWQFPVRGLPVPEEAGDELMAYASVRLFVERVRRLRPGFSPEEEREGVVDVCRLLQGMPLALELAAAWTKVLSCGEIAAELRDNPTFLTTRARNALDRHGSMQAVFEQSWALLTKKEQHTFGRLAHFRGGFSREAAADVAEATLPILSNLQDHSLLRREQGRYHLHELLRQFALEKLRRSPEALAQTRERHANYYVEFLHARRGDLLGGRQREAIQEIARERENIRLAWRSVVDAGDIARIEKAIQPLSLFYQFQSRYREGVRAFTAALKAIEDGRRARLLLQIDLAWFQIRLGELEAAETALRECEALYRRLDVPPVDGHGTDPRLALGIIASIRGEYDSAARLAEAAREAGEANGQRWNRQFACYLLARMALVQGNYEEAEEYAEQAYALTRETGDRWFMAYCLNELGNVALAHGEPARARRRYRKSYALRRTFADPEGMAVALAHLGEVARLQGQFGEARRLYEESREIYAEIGDDGGLATVLLGLAQVATAENNVHEAHRLFLRALSIAINIHYSPLILAILGGIGLLWLEQDSGDQGMALLSLVQHHSAAESEVRERARRRLEQARKDLAPASFTDAERFHDADLMAVAQRVLTRMAARPGGVDGTDKETAPPASSGGGQPLVEPLTARELEVLGLIAQGNTNREVADEMVISVGTVKWYTSQIYGKLAVGNRTEAVARARELGILP